MKVFSGNGVELDECVRCKGDGKYQVLVQERDSQEIVFQLCEACRGRGYVKKGSQHEDVHKQ